MSIESKLNDWYAAGDTGSSSKTMAAHLTGRTASGTNYPSDGADLGRCLRLILAIPELRERIPQMAALGKYWSALVANWDDLEKLMIEETGPEFDKHKPAPRTYKLMQSILRPIEDADPRVVRFGPHATLRFGR